MSDKCKHKRKPDDFCFICDTAPEDDMRFAILRREITDLQRRLELLKMCAFAPKAGTERTIYYEKLKTIGEVE